MPDWEQTATTRSSMGRQELLKLSDGGACAVNDDPHAASNANSHGRERLLASNTSSHGHEWLVVRNTSNHGYTMG